MEKKEVFSQFGGNQKIVQRVTGSIGRENTFFFYVRESTGDFDGCQRRSIVAIMM